MPDKQNDNKFMAMLERRGIVRKTDAEEESPESEPAGDRARPEADLRSLFNASPPPRQPVPGLPNPIMPGERGVQAGSPRVENPAPELPKPMQPRQDDPEPRRQPAPAPLQPLAQQPDRQHSPQESLSPRDQSAPQPPHREPVRPPEPLKAPEPAKSPFFSPGADPFRNAPAKAPDAQPSRGEAPHYERPPEPPPPPPPDYTERYLEIDELYEALSLKSKRTDTIYLIEEYLKSLPDSLPEESRREIVRKLIAASGFDYDLLMGDGVLRVKTLKDYAEKFARHTDDYIASRNAELAELEQQRVRIQRLIENRRELHKKQFFSIETEAQRLKEILTFISE